MLPTGTHLTSAPLFFSSSWARDKTGLRTAGNSMARKARIYNTFNSSGTWAEQGGAAGKLSDATKPVQPSHL